MFINTSQILTGVNNFIENEIGKNAVGVNKFIVYFAMPIVNKKITKTINTFAENELTKELFNENHDVDLDSVYSMAKTAVRKSGQFVYYGIVFNETDIDKLYTYIRGDNI